MRCVERLGSPSPRSYSVFCASAPTTSTRHVADTASTSSMARHPTPRSPGDGSKVRLRITTAAPVHRTGPARSARRRPGTQPDRIRQQSDIIDCQQQNLISNSGEPPTGTSSSHRAVWSRLPPDRRRLIKVVERRKANGATGTPPPHAVAVAERWTVSSLSIFKVRSDEGCELVQPVDVQYEELYQALAGKPLSSAWRPFAVTAPRRVSPPLPRAPRRRTRSMAG